MFWTRGHVGATSPGDKGGHQVTGQFYEVQDHPAAETPNVSARSRTCEQPVAQEPGSDRRTIGAGKPTWEMKLACDVTGEHGRWEPEIQLRAGAARGFSRAAALYRVDPPWLVTLFLGVSACASLRIIPRGRP